jgi:hypothetical protein
MKKYKYIHIKQVDDEVFNNKPVYRIFNNKSGDQLGILSYYKPWKSYIFTTKETCLFDLSCLKDITNFMENEIKP